MKPTPQTTPPAPTAASQPTTPAAPAAEFIGVSRRFGDVAAVDGIDLTIERGKLTTLLGPSGCGKTTSLRMLAGYAAPSEGRILIDGVDSTRTPPERRGLGMVFQSYALFPHMSVADNVGYGLKLRKVTRTERQARVGEALELVGLGHLAKSRPRKLSGGQQQRVALARAIAIRPKLLLLDEPLSNLDARLRVQMRAEIRRIQAETGLTVVLVTHDQDEALELSDVMVVMRAGKIVQRGAPETVFRNPADRFVAEFLGYENFLTGTDGALLTVRPEQLRLDDDPAPEQGPDAPAGLSLQGTVTDVAFRGVDLVVTVAAADPSGRTVRIVAEVRESGSGGPRSAGRRPGDRVRLTAPEHSLIRVQD
ncbi:ABC transporter ATP-binding protein [Streptomyces shenzhenensis]|uniref:ABC transporter ATP-binding protein n=1 Tax=Streptomyces shenzhenensis TaxID=943815 RepID=UPI00382C190C